MKQIELKFTIGYQDVKIPLLVEPQPGKPDRFFVEVPDGYGADDLYITTAFIDAPCGQAHLITTPWVAKLVCELRGTHDQHKAFLTFGDEEVTVMWWNPPPAPA